MIGFYAAGAMGSGGGGGTPFAATVLSMAPWAYYKLDETSGTAANDSSGNSRNGTYITGPVPASPVFAGSSGATDSSRVAGASFSTAGGAFSLVLCFRTSSTDSLMHLISGDAAGNRLWQWRLSNGEPQFVGFQPSLGLTVTGSGDYRDGNPHMAVLVVDSALPNASGKVKLFMDGSQVAASIGDVRPGSGSIALSIGSRNTGASLEPFSGIQDEAIAFDYPLSSAQVSALWAARNVS